MADLVQELSSRTGIPPEQVSKGLGAVLMFLKKELGEDTFDKLQSSIPSASALTSNFQAAPESPDAVPAQSSIFEVVSGLAGKLLGGQAGAGADLLSSLSKLGYKPEQIESFLPKALEMIKSHLSPELVQKILSALPLLAQFLTSGAKHEA